MSRETTILCDFESGACKRTANSYRVWRDGDKQAWAVDLCDEHARPLLDLVERAELVDLPVKPRVRMEVTKLKTTDRTAHLKKG